MIPMRWIHVGAAGIVLLAALPLFAQSTMPAGSAAGHEPASSPASQPASAWVAGSTQSPDAPTPTTIKPPQERYGLMVLAPPLLTIVLAIAIRSVIPALAIGVFMAAAMMVPCLPADEAYGGGVVGVLRLGVETYFVGALSDADHIKTLIFSLTIAGMVGVIAVNGGTRALVDRVSRWASTPARGQLSAWAAGIIVFFDDYANAMIVGPSMRPITDRLGVSRAKLAYIVDSTAAPVSSIALIGTWVGAEISYIQTGLSGLTDPPAFLDGVTAYGAFLASIPYRFYAILALVMVVLIAWLGRDFGPMRRAEAEFDAIEAAEEIKPASEAEKAGSVWYALAPILVLVTVTMVLLVLTGMPDEPLREVKLKGDGPRWLGLVQLIIGNADAYNSLLYGALASIVVAVLISVVFAKMRIVTAMDGATEAMSRVFPTFIVLILAWTFSAAMKDLQLGRVAVVFLTDLREAQMFDARLLPMLIFVSACIVSFATGTSWGTMGILCPATVTIAAGLFEAYPTDQALTLFYASVGAVLAGAIFGDHCSPISDTTVLSSLACECPLEKHVWTQLPYAIVVALVSTLAGDVLCRMYDQPWWVGLLAGSAALWLIVLLFGRRPVRLMPTRPDSTRGA
ncbi:MAG: Na+/H+ antiporter NhaC family protein [Planctomycetota bacterium]|nr:MAG: Na+/H+ antiporter NhaC family protein [Planctomycetota bacterium]